MGSSSPALNQLAFPALLDRSAIMALRFTTPSSAGGFDDLQLGGDAASMADSFATVATGRGKRAKIAPCLGDDVVGSIHGMLFFRSQMILCLRKQVFSVNRNSFSCIRLHYFKYKG